MGEARIEMKLVERFVMCTKHEVVVKLSVIASGDYNKSSK